MTDGIQRWQVGPVVITSILEDQTDHIPREFFLPSLTTADVKHHDWLAPHFADADGNLSLRVQALVIEIGGRSVVVDPCVGNGKPRRSSSGTTSTGRSLNASPPLASIRHGWTSWCTRTSVPRACGR